MRLHYMKGHDFKKEQVLSKLEVEKKVAWHAPLKIHSINQLKVILGFPNPGKVYKKKQKYAGVFN